MAIRMSPLAALVKGGLAGALGTVAMDLLWYRRYRRSGGQSRFIEWEFRSSASSWEKAPAPARAGKQLYEGLFKRELSPAQIGITTNVMHWGYGTGWGALYGVLAGSLPRRPPWSGLAFGTAVWGTDYVVLPAAGIYQPIWKYDLETLWKDLSAHLVYGAGTAAAFSAL
jgi:uncharacterized protein DUF1440